jgi:5-methyltetrahydropteroyltriglutamate--homocysteine methyltransferase
VKFGTVSAQTLANIMWNQHYPSDEALLADVADAMNAELRDLAAAGCPLIQLEEPWIHFLALRPEGTPARLQAMVDAFNREVRGVEAEVWVHTCWGNPNQQRHFWEPPSYERSLDHLFQLDADVITLECASSGGRDLPLLRRTPKTKKIAIGAVSHTNTVVEPATVVADLIRRALEHVPAERLIVSTDCGFGREGLNRRIAFYKTVALVQGTNLVRRELGLPEAEIRAADPRYSLTPVPD